MNKFFKNGLSTMAGLAIMALATTASAECLSGPLCGSAGYHPQQNFRPFDLEVSATVNGFGAAQTVIDGSAGVTGEVFAGRDSFSNQAITAWLGSDLCPNDCSEGGFDVTQTVKEKVFSGGYATNSGAGGTSASIVGVTNSAALTDLKIRFGNHNE